MSGLFRSLIQKMVKVWAKGGACRGTIARRFRGSFGSRAGSADEQQDGRSSGYRRDQAGKPNSRERRARNLVRFLVLGGDEQAPVHEHGVQLRGAWLTGILDLDHAEVPRPLEIAH